MAGSRKRPRGRRTRAPKAESPKMRSRPHSSRWLGLSAVVLTATVGAFVWQMNRPSKDAPQQHSQPGQSTLQTPPAPDSARVQSQPAETETTPTQPGATRTAEQTSPATSPSQPPTDAPPEITRLLQAERMLAERILATFPQDVDAHLLLARVTRYQGDSQTALTTLRKASALAPERTDLTEEMAVIAKDQGNPAEATKILEEAIASKPQAPGLRWVLADMLVTQGDYGQALSLLEAEQALAPNAPRVHYLLGQVHSHQGNLEQAQESYQKTIDLDPNHLNAHYALGSVYLKRKQRELAQKYLKEFHRLKAVSQTHVDERDRLGDMNRAKQRIAASRYLGYKIFYRYGQRENAGRLLDQAAQLDPQNTIVVERQALLALEKKQYAQAVALYKKALQLSPEKSIYYLNLSKIYTQSRRPAEAQQLLEEGHRRCPNDARILRALIQQHLTVQADLPRTLVLARKVLQLKETAEHYYLLACAHYANRDRDQALNAIQAALERDPDNPRFRGMHATLSQ